VGGVGGTYQEQKWGIYGPELDGMAKEIQAVLYHCESFETRLSIVPDVSPAPQKKRLTYRTIKAILMPPSHRAGDSTRCTRTNNPLPAQK